MISGKKGVKRFLLCFSLLATTAFFTPLGTATAYDSLSYAVNEGDCLWSIANKFGVSIESIQISNSLESDLLQLGQSLTIPAGTNTYQTGTDIYYPASVDSISYTVNSGDSLWLIANRFGTSIEAIMSANNLTSDQLQPGQILLIPVNSSSYQPVSRGSFTRPDIPQDSSSVNSAKVGELIDWSQINDLFPIGSNATLLDFETGLTFRIHHLFGTNHADCEPLTAEDTSIMLDCFGGSWSWERRAAILILDECAIACSMAGMPHGSSQDIYGNNFDGMFDLHFLNSRTHGSNQIDWDHQSMVRRAAGL